MANTIHVGAQTGHQAAVNKVKGGKGPKGGGGKGKGGRGGRGRGGGGIQQLANMQARQQIAAAEMPIEQQIKAERAANLQKAKTQMGFSKAAAALMQSAAPAVGDAYTGAANADAGYARGLGTGVQQQLDQNQQQSNDFLTQMGTPQGALQQTAPVGDMAYGLQGYIPASTLQREGAAWESAAQLAPGNELHAGQQMAESTLANDPQLTSLQGELAKLAATQPAVYQDILKNFQEQAYRKATLSQAQQRIGIEAFRANTSAQQGQQRIALEGARLNIEARRAANSNAQGWARIGLEGKRLKMEAARLEMKKAGGGFTPNEIMGIKSKAAGMAQDLHNGIPATSTKAALPPMSYKAALKYMVMRGIPPSIAINELRGAGYKVPKDLGPLNGIIRKYGGPGPLTSSIVETPAAKALVGLAHEYLGTPYVWGGESPKGFDCSGFLQYLYGKVGIGIPRTTYDQWKTGRSVPKGQLQPGDAVFFRGSDSRGGLPGHVGIYIGDGMMIDAPHTGARVRIESISTFGGYMGARRYGRG